MALDEFDDGMELPPAVIALYEAQQAVQKHYEHTGLKFTLDGRMLGDIGEALVSEHYGIDRCQQRMGGVDGLAPDKRTVQIKATQYKNVGPRFTPGNAFASHLMFVWIDFANTKRAYLRYNGPEAPIRAYLPIQFAQTVTVNLQTVLAEDGKLRDDQRLPRLR